MAVRIDNPPLDDTRALVQAVFAIIKKDERALFICPAGQGSAVVQRIRVMVSRARKKLERKNVRQQYFKIHHDIFPWTEMVEGFPGKRFEAVVMWRSRGIRHVMMEELEVMI